MVDYVACKFLCAVPVPDRNHPNLVRQKKKLRGPFYQSIIEENISFFSSSFFLGGREGEFRVICTLTPDLTTIRARQSLFSQL